MKTIPPPCPEPENGPKYWRSLDSLADTPEFRRWAEREFPAGASELTDPVTRRSFVKLMSASFLLAGFGLAGSGCRRPVENIYPFSKMPENYVHGLAKFYATAMPTRGSAVALLAKSNDGRPTKVEGNAQHPDHLSGTDRFTQASILNLYDPDRAIRFTKDGTNATPEQAFDFLSQLSNKFQANRGQGLAILVEQSSSPSRARLAKELVAKLPEATWAEYEPVDFYIHRDAGTAVNRPAGTPKDSVIEPDFHFEKAKVIVSLDSDFIGSEQNPHLNINRFAKSRKTTSAADSISRLYVVEGMMTLTGANADHRLRIAPSQVAAVAARLAKEITGSTAGDELSQSPSLAGHESWIVECAKDLMANKGQGLVVAGHNQSHQVHLLAHAMNAALGNSGKTVTFHVVPSGHSSGYGGIYVLAESLKAGKIDTLVILGGNPVYNAPADAEWETAQSKAKTVVRLGYYEDETFPSKGYQFPLAHFLESWGDARTADGTLVPVQPLIEPLFGGVTEIEFLARLIGAEKTSPYEIVRETFGGVTKGGEEEWKKFLHDGYWENTAYGEVAGVTQAESVLAAFTEAVKNFPKPLPAPSKDSLEIIFHRDYKMDDGRFNNNGWLQELPDPITKLTWENAILMSVKTAKELGVYYDNLENNRINAPWVKLTLDGREIEGPVWAQPGQADNTVAVSLGYGRTKTGRVGRGSGFNAYKLRTVKAYHFGAGAKITKTGTTHPLSITQDHGTMEGRPIIREATLQEYRDHPKFAQAFNMEEPPVFQSLYPNPLDEARKTAHHQWGMSIDLSSCVGCSACMVACQSENNIPIVGKDQVANNREMHWIRIDRYYTGDAEKEDGIQVINQPMLCQHCEAAPCENVCPVNATVHDQEGLNLMVYNRCVGTRYCSNNCPYKVRRFNFFDYNRRTLEQLTGPVYTTPLVPTKGQASVLDWWKDPDRGSKPSDEWELLKLVKNPEVTVRMRGVMEKCSYCIQRIEGAKITQKVKAGATDNVVLKESEGTVPKTACQQACPAEAIVFGNIADPESQVSKLKAQDRDYKVLDFLNTKPRTTYLARIRNPNPKMPDAYKTPHSTEEFEQHNPNVKLFEGEGTVSAHVETAEKKSGKGAL